MKHRAHGLLVRSLVPAFESRLLLLRTRSGDLLEVRLRWMALATWNRAPLAGFHPVMIGRFVVAVRIDA